METTASGKPLPPPCDPEVAQYGTAILTVTGVPSEVLEEWVKRVAAASGQRVDWHFVEGRATVKVLGDVARAREESRRLWPALHHYVPESHRAEI